MPVSTAGSRLEREIVVRRQLHGATILTLHREPVRDRHAFGETIVGDLAAEGLLGHVLWSTDCAIEDVDVRDFRRMSEAGMFLVRLDLGLPGGPAQRRAAVTAVQVLRRLGVLVEYDFDLVAPVARFDVVRRNLDYLASVVCDGSTPLTFRWPVPEPSGCSPWLAAFRERLAATIGPWLDESGLAARLTGAWADLVVSERLLHNVAGVAAHRIALQRLTMRCNAELLSLVSRSARDFESRGDSALLDAENLRARCAGLGRVLDALQARFLEANAGTLIRSGSVPLTAPAIPLRA
ncbi:MAG TPA: hypothetical protein VGJ44_11965 [Kribbellaceae bacterium]